MGGLWLRRMRPGLVGSLRHRVRWRLLHIQGRLPLLLVCSIDLVPHQQRSTTVATRSTLFCQLHNSLGGGNAPQGGMEVVLIPLLETAPTPEPALGPEAALVPDVALDPENAVLDP